MIILCCVCLFSLFSCKCTEREFILLFFRQINVTIESRPSLATKCSQADEVPREYIIFCNVIKDEIRAVSIAKWDEATDQRVWSSLGKYQFN